MKQIKPKPVLQEAGLKIQPLSVAPAEKTSRNEKLLALLLFLPCLFLRPVLDNDLWFLLNSGRYVLAHGIPYIEPFTLHANMNFVMQQWLSAVIYWVVYSHLGTYGVLTFVCIIFAGIIAIIYQMTRKISGGNFLASFLTTLLVSILLTQFLFTRPIIFTLIVLVSELALLERYIRTQKVGCLIPLPFLSALLINLQAAMWPMQFVLLLPYFIDSFHFKALMVEGQGYIKKYLFPAIGLMFVAGFANPYGIDSITYLLRSYGYSEFTMIDEMKPPNINQWTGMIIFGVLLLVAAVYLLHRNGKTRVRYALLTFGTALLALSSIRNFVVFLVCGVFPLAYFLKDIRLPENEEKAVKSTVRMRILLTALLACGVVYLSVGQVSAIADAVLPPPVAAPVNYLVQHANPDDVVLYTGYNDGAYAEYMGFHPYMDARAEVFVIKNNGKKDIMHEYIQMEKGELYYKDVLDQYQFTHLLVTSQDILGTYLPFDSDYRAVYQDDTYTVFERISAG